MNVLRTFNLGPVYRGYLTSKTEGSEYLSEVTICNILSYFHHVGIHSYSQDFTK